MLVLKRWVWPGLKFLVALVIAVALVQLAFFPASADDDPAQSAALPSGALQDPVVAVETGTIRNDVEVKGQIEPLPSSTVKATATGTVNAVRVDADQGVEQGAPLIQIMTETPVDPPADPTLPQPKPKVTYTNVTAPIDGAVSSLDVLVGQDVSIGETVAIVAPSSFRVSAKLTAADLYRLLQRPTEASVTIPDGPAPFACTNLRIGTAGSGAGTGTGADTGQDSGATGADSTALTCDVPGDVTVFAGLTASVTVPAGLAENVLTVPLTAVSGTAASGTVTVLAHRAASDDGSASGASGTSGATGATGASGSEPGRETREVTLGLNDGKRVEVTGGLAEGDQVLEFVPGTDAQEDDASISGGGVVIG
ncbi:HlyD family efflux transporter periplasmic adaptor subunit [Curtobacterium sp. Leaf261]|uniref:HlyD family efflux transporter periplasmic adaptor subunit n=1 Tax=Curtobacterium sp. Leaf261 TaxID=1736311 RepID=UPI0006F6E1CB|nr:HlyD family efflux transporter periplasmic adaptor subunit [Curtobacterium sp. Leaf261]KQO63084.1 hypothetical protein ASF23_09460 [Curtobacterium sp. Leaf261]